MTITNNIRYTLSVITLTIAYTLVVIGSCLMSMTDVLAGADMEHTPVKDWWELYCKELELVKVSLL